VTTFHLTGLSADSPLDFLAVLGMARLAPAGTRLHFDGTTPVLTSPVADAPTLGQAIFYALEAATKTLRIGDTPVSELAAGSNRPILDTLDPLVNADWEDRLPVTLANIGQWDRMLGEKGEVPAHTLFFSTGQTNLRASLRDAWKTKPALTADEVTAVLEGGLFNAALGNTQFRYYPTGAADLVQNGHSLSVVAPLAELLAMTAVLALPARFRRRENGKEFIEWAINSIPMSPDAVTALQALDRTPAAFTRYRAPVHRGDQGRSHFAGMGVPVACA